MSDPSVRWGVLGGVSVSIDGQELKLSRQGRYVLGCLLREPGEAVPAELLVRPRAGVTTEAAIGAGRVAVSRLRAALGNESLESHLVTTAAGYVIDVDPVSVDHLVFARRVQEAEATEQPAVGLERVEAALSSWTGGPYGEWRSDAAFEAHGRALEELHRGAVDLWGELVVTAGTDCRALAVLESAVAEEPLRERRWASLMLGHYRFGNQSEALRTFERARSVLRDELDLEPGPELEALAKAIVRRDPALDDAPRAQFARVCSRPPPSGSTVVGRDDEIGDILALLDRHRTVTISGFGGMGKSAVAREVASRSDRPSWVVPLTGVPHTQLPRVVAASVGLSRRFGDATLKLAIADRLDEHGGLVVLDGCEHIVDRVETFVTELLDSSVAARVMTTSRVDLQVAGSVTFPLGPLAAGSRADPGPAALIAADFAMIRPSELAEQWDVVARICEQAGGIPLALELMGKAVANGVLVPSTGPMLDRAIGAALACLPAEARHLVEVLAVVPGDTSIAFLTELLSQDHGSLRRTIGHAVRSGLMVRRAVADRGRVGLVEPTGHAINALVPEAVKRSVHADVRRTVFNLARQCRPTVTDAGDEEVSALLDDERHIVQWLFDRLDHADQRTLISQLGPRWGDCVGTAEAEGRRERAVLSPIA